jgi:hypothetical protein
VAWVGDRVERRGAELLLRFMREVREAGGRVECSNDPLVNSFETLGELGPSLAGWIANYESKRKKERARIAIETSAREGSHRGRIPWGYITEGTKFARRLVPTPEGVIYIPEIYRRAIAGESVRAIAAWLDSQGVKPRGIDNARSPKGKTGQWQPRSVAALIHNTAYAGETADGRQIQALVTWEIWRAAQVALGARFRRGQTSEGNPKWLSGEAAGCAMCGGPMNVKGSNVKYLRCERAGRDDPQRKPCTTPANMVPFETAVRLADEYMSGLGQFVYEQVVVEGNATLRQAMLEDIERRARNAARLPFDQMMPVMRELEAERKQIPEETPGSRVVVQLWQPDGNPENYGSWWRRMDTAERRAFLTDEVWLSFLNLDHAEAAKVLERREPDVTEGNIGMYGDYVDDLEPEE